MNPSKEMPTDLIDQQKVYHFIDVIFTENFFDTI